MVTALALIAAAAAVLALAGVAYTGLVQRRRLELLERRATAIERDARLENVRAASAIAALNEARRALGELAEHPDETARRRAEAGLVSSVMGGA